MVLYLYIPKDKQSRAFVDNVNIPRILRSEFAFAEGYFKRKADIIRRLNWLDVPDELRPEGYEQYKVMTDEDICKNCTGENGFCNTCNIAGN